MSTRFVVAPFGDRAIEIVTENALHARRVSHALTRHLTRSTYDDVVVGWDRVVVHLRPGVAPSSYVADIARMLDPLPDDDPGLAREHVVRAIYDGPDLRELAEANGITVDEVAQLHATPTYVAEVIGFLPGFAYLAGVDPAIQRPRRASPRPRVEPRTIGIAGAHTAIYPLASPGGWNLIGRTLDPSPFDPTRTPPTRFSIGDRVRFEIVEVKR